jgi:hypothetical protein
MVQGVGGEGIGGFMTCTVGSAMLQVKYIQHMHFPPCVAFQTTALCHFQRCFIWRPALSPAAEAAAELSAGLQNLLSGDLDLPLRPHSNFNLASTSFYQPLPTSAPSYRPLYFPLRWPVTSLSTSKVLQLTFIYLYVRLLTSLDLDVSLLDVLLPTSIYLYVVLPTRHHSFRPLSVVPLHQLRILALLTTSAMRVVVGEDGMGVLSKNGVQTFLVSARGLLTYLLLVSRRLKLRMGARAEIGPAPQLKRKPT